MKLWHVSEQPGISVFEPRLPVNAESEAMQACVWAVADSHLTNYLFPRDCPRVAARAVQGARQIDVTRFLAPCSDATLYIEAVWQQRAETTPLWLYEFSAASFESIDANAGYFVSTRAVVPVGCRRLDAPLQELRARSAALRIVPRLRPLADAVAGSSLSFSVIRLRNALP